MQKTPKAKGHTYHGWSRRPEYYIWQAIIQRCYNKDNPRYPHYGRRGITVCKKWLTFAGFISDMGPRPSNKHSIGRKHNNKGYYLKNCRWETRKEQDLNTSKTTKVTYNGKTLSVMEWSIITGMHYRTLHARLFERKRWTVKEAFTKPLRWRHKYGPKT